MQETEWYYYIEVPVHTYSMDTMGIWSRRDNSVQNSSSFSAGKKTTS